MSDILFYDPKSKYFEFSNFYQSPIKIDNIKYPTVEHYFQAMKFYNPENKESLWFMNKILEQKTAGKVKFLSSQKTGGPYSWHKPLAEISKESIKRGVKLRSDWEEEKVKVMIKGCLYKYLFNPKL